MKRFIYLAAVASIALVGCAKNEAVAPESGTSDQLITFETPALGVATKASVPTVNYPSSGKFKVVGKVHSADYNGDWVGATTYMNTDVRLESSKWVPVNTSDVVQNYYWPKGNDQRITFIAYSPYDVTPAPSINNAGVNFTDYVVAADANVDLLYSYRTYNKTSSTSGTGSLTLGSDTYNYYDEDDTDHTGSPVPPHYDGVNILFEHALSSINFTVKKGADYEGNVITLKKITLKQINSKANFSEGLPATGQTTDGIVVEGTATWTSHSTPVDTYVPFSANYAVTTTATSVGTVKYLIPQTLTDDMKVTIDYTLENPEHVVVNCTATVKLNDYAVTSWERGKKYIYNIIITLDQIYFAPQVVDWETPSTVPGDITI